MGSPVHCMIEDTVMYMQIVNAHFLKGLLFASVNNSIIGIYPGDSIKQCF